MCTIISIRFALININLFDGEGVHVLGDRDRTGGLLDTSATKASSTRTYINQRGKRADPAGWVVKPCLEANAQRHQTSAQVS